MNKKEPKLYKYEIENLGHNWKRNDDGSVYIFGLDEGFHIGPICTACGYSFCHHCQELPDCECTAIIDVVAENLPEQLMSGKEKYEQEDKRPSDN